ASSFTVSPVVAKLVAFGIAGGIAALAGALLGGLRVQFGPDAFGVEESLQAVAMVVIGGVGSVAGPLLGALYVVGAPALFGDTTAVRMLTSGAGLLVLLLNVIGGFLPASGGVELLGTDVSALPPHRRARLGLGRIFQDARLFPDLTVVETIEVALEGRERTELVPSMLAMAPARRAERWKAGEAAEIVDLLGLGAYAQSFIGDLSTGSRRI